MLYKEWSQSLYHSNLFVPLSKIDKIVSNAVDPGYASVYSFVSKPSSAVGLGKHIVSADCVTLDLDGGDEELEVAEAILVSQGLGYSVWSSGSKGYHVMIGHSKIEGVHLPYSHLKWVQGLELPHDYTLYQHGRLLSLPGRVHPKTGRRKMLLKEVKGNKAVIELLEPVTKDVTPSQFDVNDLQTAVLRLCSLVVNGPTEGDRHMTIWKMSRDMMKAGWDHDTTLDIMNSVNATWDNPKSDKDVRKAVRGAYK